VLAPPDEPGLADGEIEIRRGVDWVFHAEDAFRRPDDEFGAGPARSLPTDTAAALTLFHDLVALGPEGNRFVNALIDEDEEQWPWAITRWGRGTEAVDLAWPAPSCASLWGLDLFRHAWNDAAERTFRASLSDADRITRLAFAWISMGCTIVDRREPEHHGGEKTTTTDWNRLGNRLASLVEHVEQRRPRHQAVRGWLVNVSLLAMPEYALPAFVPAQLFKQDVLIRFWRQTQNYRLHRQKRLAALARIFNSVGERLVVSLRQASSDVLPPPALKSITLVAAGQHPRDEDEPLEPYKAGGKKVKARSRAPGGARRKAAQK
jgi:hypothetical protein